MKERLHNIVSKLKPSKSELFTTSVTTLILAGALAIPDWWNSQPVTCSQNTGFGRSTIDLRRRVMLGEGVQNIELDSQFFMKNTSEAIINSDSACPATTVLLRYNLDNQQLIVGAILDSKRVDLQHSQGIGSFQRINPSRPHTISILFSNWELIGMAVDGRLTDQFHLDN